MDTVLRKNQANIIFKKLLLNPFFIGVFSGYIFSNLSLGLITTGFTVLLWGYNIYTSIIIVSTVLMTLLTGNINFEIILLFYITLAYFLKNSDKLSRLNIEKNLLFIIFSFIFISLYPLWEMILGHIPSQILNDINTAGRILLVTAVFLSIDRIKKMVIQNRDKQVIFKYLIIFILSAAGILGDNYVIFIWFPGILLLLFLELNSYSICTKYLSNINIDRSFFPGIFLIIAFISIYLLISLNLFILLIIIVMSYIYIFRKKKFSLSGNNLYFTDFWFNCCQN